MGVVTGEWFIDRKVITHKSPMPFGFDGSGYLRTIARNQKPMRRSPMPFGFDGSGYCIIYPAMSGWALWSPMPFGFDGSGYSRLSEC